MTRMTAKDSAIGISPVIRPSRASAEINQHVSLVTLS